MGEIADMMLDGTLCEACGEYIGEGSGIPGYCSPQCAADRGMSYTPPRSRKQRRERQHGVADRGERVEFAPGAADPQQAHKPHRCLDCGRRFRLEVAARDHWRAMHGTKAGR